MGWTFHTADGSERTRRADTEEAASQVKHLEHREAELVRRLAVLEERHEFFPNDVTSRQVDELTAKLDALRMQLEAARGSVRSGD